MNLTALAKQAILKRWPTEYDRIAAASLVLQGKPVIYSVSIKDGTIEAFDTIHIHGVGVIANNVIKVPDGNIPPSDWP